MSSNIVDRFRQDIIDSYTFESDSFRLGTAILNNNPVNNTEINIPLCTLNRHGLIAGATGTGKTKTLQLFAENLSNKGVPVILLDIKGDLSGLAQPGMINNKIIERYERLGGEKWTPYQYPVEFLTISHEKGVRLRSTVTEFGPILLSKILGLNETQTSFISLIFKYSNDNQLPLVDLKDFIQILQYISKEGKESIEQVYGKIALSSTGTILRKTIELQQQNADLFFGEPSFDISDLMRTDSSTGQAIINIIRVINIQDKIKLFSTFMLSLLSKLYTLMPEIGDVNKPKLVMFIDEAHLLFQQSIDTLIQQIETVIKLIRSKGIGIIFCTQNPTDIPSTILSQLGLKIQHALRASTSKDRKNIKKMSENFPPTNYYVVDQLLTSMSIGEALVSLLNEQGQPTILTVCMMCTPRSRMNILNSQEIDYLIARSQLVNKYSQTIDRESAYEILSQRMEAIRLSDENKKESSKRERKGETNEMYRQNQSAKSTKKRRTRTSTRQSTTFEKVLNSATSKEISRTATNIFTRSLLDSLGLNSTKKSRI